ncbi:MAG: glycosyltransferase family 4 protein [Sulfurimicrobium sp.]|nr:glycosyltransferase family 4 protein [Sulfurimicrobium sp.]
MTTAKLHIVHTEASLGWGCQEIRILTQEAGMMQRGHQVTLLCPPEAKIFEEARLRGVPAVALPIGRKNLSGVLALHRWLRNNPADILNTHSSTDTWLAALASLLPGVRAPIVRTRHISAPIPNNRATRWLYQSATRHIVTTGEKLRQQLIEENGYRPEGITSVPTGIDTSRFVPGDKRLARRQLGLPEEGAIIGIVATLRSWKGHAYLLDAFAALGDATARLLIVGGGPQSDALHKKVAELGLQERVAMPGNQRDVLPWLQAMDVFVLPSYANEGVPQALLQAMLCALPIVTTPVGSILDAIQDGKNGLVVEPRSAEALQQALQRLLQEPGLGLALAEHARMDGLEKFGLQGMLDKMEAIFCNAAHG